MIEIKKINEKIEDKDKEIIRGMKIKVKKGEVEEIMGKKG